MVDLRRSIRPGITGPKDGKGGGGPDGGGKGTFRRNSLGVTDNPSMGVSRTGSDATPRKLDIGLEQLVVPVVVGVSVCVTTVVMVVVVVVVVVNR